jgi:hypothetical protein
MSREKARIGARHRRARSTAEGGIANSNTENDPSEWTTGDEPMTGAKASYLRTLCEEDVEQFDNTLTRAEASRRTDALQRVTGRGKHAEG